MINYLALAEYLPTFLTAAVILTLLIGVPYQLQKTICRVETERDYDV